MGPQRTLAARVLLTALCCLLAFTASVSAQVVKASPSDILGDPDRFDGQTIVITGTVTNLQERVSRRGNPYYTLDLRDGKQAIRVFSFGAAPCRAGAATVEGTFAKLKKQGKYTFYNEVEATRVTCR
ncbi:MAG TPA: hypothetical protein VFE48_23730 [Methylomirabilota bacterium]|nr:hypothetical protein [Methylomirabilota bacterium]